MLVVVGVDGGFEAVHLYLTPLSETLHQSRVHRSQLEATAWSSQQTDDQTHFFASFLLKKPPNKVTKSASF